MLFPSATFLFLFLPFVIVIYYSLLRNKRSLQNVFLFFVSVFFYAWGEPSFVFGMLLSIALNYFFGRYIGTHRENHKQCKTALIISLVFNLSLLFVFKYLTFTLSNIERLFGCSLAIPAIALPIGISFFTFQAMSYVIDVYRGEPHQTRILNVGLYIAFFPQLIAGPIVRYKTIAEQIDGRRESFEDFSAGVVRFIVGLGKKVLLANTLAVVADSLFNGSVESLSIASAWVGAIAYTLQIFLDFSGYSDMAIGLGKMFGFHFMENFQHPYISASITEFWRRWHISLGTWFRDYLYIPLGGSRVTKRSRLVFNLLTVWFLTGVWHGANWTFIVWGLIYFVLLVFEKLTGLPGNKRPRAWQHIYTLLFVILGWVFFRSDSVSDACAYVAAMFGGTGRLIDNSALFYLKENAACFAAALMVSTPVPQTLFVRLSDKKWGDVAVSAFLAAIFLMCVVYIIKGTYNPFIYFNF